MIKLMKQSDIMKCPHYIISPDHYREDGSCKCDDAEERARMVRDWGYSWESFKGIPLREE